jgi:hypothetical protein
VTQWVSWQASREKALTLLETHSDSLDEYLKYEQGEWNAVFNGDLTPCYEFAYLGWD